MTVAALGAGLLAMAILFAMRTPTARGQQADDTAAAAAPATGAATTGTTTPGSGDQPTATRPSSTLTVGVGRSTLITAPLPTKTVSIGDPRIADVQILSPTQLLISGKGVGTTDLVLFDANGRAEQLEVLVAADGPGTLAELRRVFPDANLDIRQSRDTLVISGKLARVEDADRLKKFMDSSGAKYVDMTTLAGVQQVQIKVTVAEANRTAIRALGVNAFFGGTNVAGGITPGPDLGGAINSATFDTAGNLLSAPSNPANTLFALFPNSDIAVFIQALAENEYLRVLSEPTLVALSGEEASFLAGGEFPIPVVQGSASTTGGVSVSVDYKKFGVQLKFRPTVTGEGNIRLHVAPEVSELSNVGAVTLQGFNIPGIATRRAETTVELKSGQTFGLAGLISQSTQARSSRVPALGDLPIIGALFRSVRYKQGDTELVLLVTASLVEPVSLARRPPLPGQFHVVPNDWEVYSLGRIQGQGAPTMTSADKDWLREKGLDRLRGPGAWVSYDNRSAVSGASNKTSNVPAPAAAAAGGGATRGGQR
jgi:pilus assembly protein CpaC